MNGLNALKLVVLVTDIETDSVLVIPAGQSQLPTVPV